VPALAPYDPVNRSIMFGYDPVRTSVACGLPPGTLNYRAQVFPVADRTAYQVGVNLLHNVLLAPAEDMARIAEVFAKVLALPDEVRQLAQA
jgi:hypothetical protein